MRERKYSPRRLILRSRLPPSLCKQPPFSDKGESGCGQRPVVTFAIGREGVAQKKGRRIKGQTPLRRCLILAIALFERRSNARAEYAAEYLGPRDRDRATDIASRSGPTRRGLSVGIAQSRDRIERSAGWNLSVQTAHSAAPAPVSPQHLCLLLGLVLCPSSSRAQPDGLNSNLWTRYLSDWN